MLIIISSHPNGVLDRRRDQNLRSIAMTVTARNVAFAAQTLGRLSSLMCCSSERISAGVRAAMVLQVAKEIMSRADYREKRATAPGKRTCAAVRSVETKEACQATARWRRYRVCFKRNAYHQLCRRKVKWKVCHLFHLLTLTCRFELFVGLVESNILQPCQSTNAMARILPQRQCVKPCHCR